MNNNLSASQRFCNERGVFFLEFFLVIALLLVAVGIFVPLARANTIAENEIQAVKNIKKLAAAVQATDQAPEKIAKLNLQELVEFSSKNNPSHFEGARWVEGKFLEWDGYLYQLYVTPENVLIYGWPRQYEKTGNACYVYKAPNQFYEARNNRRHYSGFRNRPNEKSALVALEKDGYYFGKDMQEWRRVKESSN